MPSSDVLTFSSHENRVDLRWVGRVWRLTVSRHCSRGDFADMGAAAVRHCQLPRRNVEHKGLHLHVHWSECALDLC